MDSGAAVTVLSKEIWDKMPYEKLEASRTSLCPFGEGKKYASLGKIRNMDFFVGDVKTEMDVEVVDVPGEIFILGVDWMAKEGAKIDIYNEIMYIGQNEIPIRYIKPEFDEEEYESEDEEMVY